MYHVTENTGNVPAFLLKLWTLVEDKSCDDLICWDTNGQSFHVLDQARFAKEVLPHYFKHNNISSFIRQLNMYGFRKVGAIEQGALKVEKDDVEFQHPYFQKGQDQLLEFIKRRTSNPKNDSLKFLHDDVSELLVDVHSIKGKQETVTNKLEQLRNENEILWREVANLRQKHAKQQQIVNKLIQFLVTLAGGNRGLSGMKRKMQLMIEEPGSQPANKMPKLNRPLSITESKSPYTVQSPTSLDMLSQSGGSTGPIIHDVTDVYHENVNNSSPVVPEQDTNNVASPPNLTQQPPEVISPEATTLATNQVAVGDTSSVLTDYLFDLTQSEALPSVNSVNTTDQHKKQQELLQQNQQQQLQQQLQQNQQLQQQLHQKQQQQLQQLQQKQQEQLKELQHKQQEQQKQDQQVQQIQQQKEQETSVTPVVSTVSSTPTTVAVCAGTSNSPACPKQEVNEQLDLMQKDLDGLKEFLSGGQFNLDNNVLLNLFSPDVQVPEPLFDNDQLTSVNNTTTDPVGNELMAFNPSDGVPMNLFDLTDEDGDLDLRLMDNLPIAFPSELNTQPSQSNQQSQNKTISTEDLD